VTYAPIRSERLGSEKQSLKDRPSSEYVRVPVGLEKQRSTSLLSEESLPTIIFDLVD
jgi:hypothetical protein